MPVAVSALTVASMMLLVWVSSLILKDASLVDRFWGLGFVLSSIAVAVYTGLGTTPAIVLLLIVSIWGLRLTLYLTWRNWGHGEDYRYVAMRQRWGNAFALKSLLFVFAFQGLILWWVVLPITIGMTEAPEIWHWTHGVGLLFWAIGLFFESVGDRQLARFKANPENKGKVLCTGVWRYTRHPNYFGDALVWWGIYCFVCAGDLARWTLLSPLLMNFFLLRVSGVPLTEKRLAKTRPEYADYVAHTSRFIPWPPKS